MPANGSSHTSRMVADGFPTADQRTKLDSNRHRLGRIWEILLRISTISGLLVLGTLLYNVINSSFGFIVSRDTFSSELLVLEVSPHVQTGESVRDAVAAVRNDSELIAIVPRGPEASTFEDLLSLELPLSDYEETFQLQAIASADNRVLAQATQADIEAGLPVGGLWSDISSELSGVPVRLLLVPDDIGVMNAWLGNLDVPELSSLEKEQLIGVLESHVSEGLIRRFERDQPFDSRSKNNIQGLIQLRVVNPQIVASFSLRDTVLRRDHAEVTAKENLAALEFKSWLTRDFITDAQSSRPLFTGIRTALFGSLWVIAITILFSVPLGIGAAIYLEEYSSHNWFGRVIETNINNLAGVPSIIYGMLGLVIFVRALNLLTSGALFALVGEQESNGRTVISAGLTLGLLVLPVIIINGQEAIRAVPNSLREASYGVGATKWMTIRHHVLPSAAPGIFTGAILAVSRAVGETAPLVVIGAATFISTDPGGIFSKFTVLPIQIYQWTARPQPEFRHIAAAAILVLLTLLLIVNTAAVLLRQRYSQHRI